MMVPALQPATNFENLSAQSDPTKLAQWTPQEIRTRLEVDQDFHLGECNDDNRRIGQRLRGVAWRSTMHGLHGAFPRSQHATSGRAVNRATVDQRDHRATKTARSAYSAPGLKPHNHCGSIVQRSAAPSLLTSNPVDDRFCNFFRLSDSRDIDRPDAVVNRGRAVSCRLAGVTLGRE